MGGIGGRYRWAVSELKLRLLKLNQLMSSQRPHFSPRSTAKPTIKVQISGRMASIGISDVVSASVYSEKTRMKKLMMMKMIIITPHVQRERGKVIDRGVHIYICL